MLERSVDLTRLPIEAIGWLIVLALGFGIRLIGLSAWPLSAGETAIASDAWALVQGNDLSSVADAHPALVQLTALMLMMFGDSDQIVRLVPLLGSAVLIGALIGLRHWFGQIPALCIGMVWAVSPVMTLSAMRLDSGVILIAAAMIALILTTLTSVEPTPGRAGLLGVTVAIGLTVSPLAWLVLPITILPAMLLIGDARLGGKGAYAAGGFGITLIAITTWFGMRPLATLDFFSESMRQLGANYLSGTGSTWEVPLVVMIIDEPLVGLLAITGLMMIAAGWSSKAAVHPAVYFSCVAWAIPMFALGVLSGSSGPERHTIGVFPLILVAGLGLAMLVERARGLDWSRGRPAIWAAVGLALLVAIFRFGELLAEGPAGDTLGWIINAAIVGILIVIPLAFFAIRLSSGGGWQLVPVGVLAIALIVAGIGMRTSLMLADTSQDRPGEILIAGSSTTAIHEIDHMVQTYSRDHTRFQQDVRDPVGGHGLVIVVHEDLRDPFAWYFRNMPNLVVVQNPEDTPAEALPDILIVPDEAFAEWESVASDYPFRTYNVAWRETGPHRSGTYQGLLFSSINPIDYPDMASFIVHRRSPTLLEIGSSEAAVMYLREDHAEVLWGGP